jgi:hypothetical protein
MLKAWGRNLSDGNPDVPRSLGVLHPARHACVALPTHGTARWSFPVRDFCGIVKLDWQDCAMVARPEIAVARVDELFGDGIGQLWSPATILVTWPAADGLPAPSVELRVIALARAEMTLDELNRLHLQAAHGVLNAALLGIERVMESSPPVPSMWADPAR